MAASDDESKPPEDDQPQIPDLSPEQQLMLVEMYRRSTGQELLALYAEIGTKNPRIIEAFKDAYRGHFMTPEMAIHAIVDRPVTIGHEQTISQPTLVAMMLDVLGLEEGQKVLDVGAGSGWTSALISCCVGPTGSVTGVELIPELAEQAKGNIAQAQQSLPQRPDFLTNITIHQAGTGLGWPEGGPYDRILVSADGGGKGKDELLGQLKPGGIMVLPVGPKLLKVTLGEDREIIEQSIGGEVAFVPLIVEDA